MKTITIKKHSIKNDLINTETGERALYVQGPEDMDASDGYHTFTELYEHRHTVFIALCRVLVESANHNGVWRSKLHSDGSAYEGWFILGIAKKLGEQITYHLPISKWESTDFAETLEKAPEYDGHTPEDVLNRLKKLY